MPPGTEKTPETPALVRLSPVPRTGTHPASNLSMTGVHTVRTPRSEPSEQHDTGIAVSVISGAVFLAIKRFVLARFPSGTLQNLCKQLDPEAREALLHARSDAWYPSDVLLRLLHAIFDKLVDGDLGRYHALVYDATLSAMRQSFREAMTLGTAHTVVTRLPTLWRSLERSDTVVSVDVRDGIAEISIRRCAASEDRLYLQTVLAMLRALLYAATGVERFVTLKRQTRRGIQLRVGGLG